MSSTSQDQGKPHPDLVVINSRGYYQVSTLYLYRVCCYHYPTRCNNSNIRDGL